MEVVAEMVSSLIEANATKEVTPFPIGGNRADK
jgi:hypothetical protein